LAVLFLGNPAFHVVSIALAIIGLILLFLYEVYYTMGNVVFYETLVGNLVLVNKNAAAGEAGFTETFEDTEFTETFETDEDDKID
jgi:hypothetical protein